MKFLLVLCLFALITCNFVDTFNCLIKQPKLVELVLKIFSYITTKDYDKILPAVIGAIGDIITAIKTCI